MSNLLPHNATLKDQAFAAWLDEEMIADNSTITLDPAECHPSLLDHIAVGYGVSIRGMTEPEARAYLGAIESIKSHQGTVGAVEDMMNVVFDDARLMEWWEDEDLDTGGFGVEVTIEPDTEAVYDQRRFALAHRLMYQAKNVRSYLQWFRVRLPPITVPVTTTTLPVHLNVQPHLPIDEIITSGLESAAAWMFDPVMHVPIAQTITTDDTNLQGGYKWQIEV